MTEIVHFVVNKDPEGLRQALANNPALANAGMPIPGCNNGNDKLGHPLHRLCDAVFSKIIDAREAIVLARILLEYGSDIDGYKTRGDINTPLIAASSLNAEDLALFYIAQGADIRYVEPAGGSTALHWAAICGLARLVKKLIENGAEIDRPDRTYQSVPVGWAAHAIASEDNAAQSSQIECIKLLLAAGADKSLISADTLSFLKTAAESDEGLRLYL